MLTKQMSWDMFHRSAPENSMLHQTDSPVIGMLNARLESISLHFDPNSQFKIKTNKLLLDAFYHWLIRGESIWCCMESLSAERGYCTNNKTRLMWWRTKIPSLVATILKFWQPSHPIISGVEGRRKRFAIGAIPSVWQKGKNTRR